VQKIDKVSGGANPSGGTVETAMDNSNGEREKGGGKESGMEIKAGGYYVVAVMRCKVWDGGG